MELGDFVSELPPSAALYEISAMLRTEELSSPIDMFIERLRKLIDFGSVDALAYNDFLGRLLAVGIVSAAEAYFRSILSLTIELCPLAQASASEKNVNLGGMLWHGRLGYTRSAFDHLSFASAEELKKAAASFAGFKLEPQTFETSLDEFDRVCLLRHGIVHNDGLMPGRNAVKLDVPRSTRPIRIVLRYEHLQDIAAVVSTLVLLFNRKLFEELCKRWAIDWRRRADWQVEQEENLFYSLWSSFVSRITLSVRPGRSRMRKSDCKRAVMLNYGLA